VCTRRYISVASYQYSQDYLMDHELLCRQWLHLSQELEGYRAKWDERKWNKFSIKYLSHSYFWFIVCLIQQRCFQECHPSLYLIFSNHFLILSFSMLLSMTALSRFCFLHIHVSTHHSVEFRGCRTKVETRCKRATSLFSITCIYTYLLSQHNT